MDTNTCNYNSYSICATCLSQDRKLFNIRDSKACMSYSELYLKVTDRICWECHRMVQKIVIFKNRVQKAQGLLWNMGNGQYNKIQCLSPLTLSTGVSVDISPSQAIAGPSMVLPIKPEPHEPAEVSKVSIKEEAIELNVDIKEIKQYDNEVTNSGNYNYYGNDTTNDNFGTSESTDDKDEGEMIVFTHTKLWTVEKAVTSAKKNTSNKRKADIPQPDFIYTETMLSNEEMKQWWQRKPTTDYYARSIPTERCEKCLEPFDKKKLKKAHEKRHSQSYGELECDICHQRAVDEQALMYHKKSHCRLLKCRYCAFAWDNVNAMRRHCSDMHNVPQVLWDCDLCDRQFSMLKKLRAHERSHRHVECPECSKAFTESSLKNHMLIHSGMPLLACPECGGQYRGRSSLHTHMLTHRTESFNSRYGRRDHVRAAHEGKPKRRPECICDYCGKSCTSKNMILEHINTHTGARPHVCKICGDTFGYKSALYLHGRFKHKIPKKPKKYV